MSHFKEYSVTSMLGSYECRACHFLSGKSAVSEYKYYPYRPQLRHMIDLWWIINTLVQMTEHSHIDCTVDIMQCDTKLEIDLSSNMNTSSSTRSFRTMIIHVQRQRVRFNIHDSKWLYYYYKQDEVWYEAMITRLQTLCVLFMMSNIVVNW